MIGPGWLPRPGWRAWKKRTLSYTRIRRRHAPKVAAPRSQVLDHEVVFDHGPKEFPVATLRPREPGARAAALVWGFERWLVARWQWMRARSIPLIVATAGAVAMMVSADMVAPSQECPHVSASAPQVGAPIGIDLQPIHVRIVR